MTVTHDLYASQYGWEINLPPGWEALPRYEGPVIAVHRPIVFASNSDPDLSMTWMIAAHPMKEEVANRFVSVMDSGSPGKKDLMEIASTIFPTIGTVDSCQMVELADGARALEVVETYEEEGDDGGAKNGYQLIFPLQGASNYPRVFQRVCFYADGAKFSANLDGIRKSARSFHYIRPYGYQQDTD
jgi:hypothetical protein